MGLIQAQFNVNKQYQMGLEWPVPWLDSLNGKAINYYLWQRPAALCRGELRIKCIDYLMCLYNYKPGIGLVYYILNGNSSLRNPVIYKNIKDQCDS